MKTRLLCNLLSLICAVCLFAGEAFAIDLQQARASGAVGEKTDGYVAAITNTAEVNALVADVNAKRKQRYEQIAKDTGQSVDVTAKIAAQEIITKLPAGATFMNAAGAWVKK